MCQSVVDSDRMPVGRDLALFNGHVSQAGGTARRLTRRSAPLVAPGYGCGERQ
jgi:hypothetical protein